MLRPRLAGEARRKRMAANALRLRSHEVGLPWPRTPSGGGAWPQCLIIFRPALTSGGNLIRGGWAAAAAFSIAGAATEPRRSAAAAPAAAAAGPPWNRWRRWRMTEPAARCERFWTPLRRSWPREISSHPGQNPGIRRGRPMPERPPPPGPRDDG